MPIQKPDRNAGIILTLALLGTATPLYAADKPMSVDVALADVSVNKVPFIIAADAGIYAKFGLDVHQFITAGAAAAIGRSGDQVPSQYISDTNKSMPIVVGGGDPTIVSIVEKGSAPRLIVSTTEDIARDDVIVLPSTPSFAALKGKKIGYSGRGTVSHYDAVAFIKKMGWDPDKDVTMVPGGANLDALASGKVDAVLASNQVVALLPEGKFKDLGPLDVYKFPLAGSGVMVTASWLPQNREIVARFLKATVQATALMKKDRKQFDASVKKWFNITDPKVLDRMFAMGQVIPTKPYPAVKGIKAAMETFDSPKMREHKAEDFYDSSFIAELDKSGFLDNPLQ